MASKDQAIGAVILIVCLVVAIGYIIALFFTEYTMNILKALLPNLTPTSKEAQYFFRMWLIGIPVLVAFIAVLAIGAWIGWTMATTPPPKPLEEIEAEEKLEEEKEEEKPEPTEKAETEEKKSRKKKE